MTQSKQNIDELFKTKLDDFEGVPFDSNSILFKHLKKQTWKDKFLSFQFKWVLRLLSVSFISAVIYFVSTNQNNTQNQYEAEKKIHSTKNNSLQFGYNNLNEDNEIAQSESKNIKNDTDIAPIAKKDENTQKKPVAFDFNHQSTAEYRWINYQGAIHATNLSKAFNSPFADFAPVVSSNNSVLFFTSRRAQNSNNNSQTKEYVYLSSKDEKTQQWTEPILLGEPFNKKNSYNSIISINKTGDKIFLYQDDRKTNGDIFETNYKNNAWTEPVPLPYPINSIYLETSITYNVDSSVVLFTSNRPGGYGDMDIWFAAKNKDGTWGNAMNAGPLINTKEKEDGVFMLPDDKTLIFSSNGHHGLGGHDIFYTQLIHGAFSTPQNLGEPINSNADDIYFYLPNNSTIAYFSSNRKGGAGEKDIYSVPFEEIENHFIRSNVKLNAVVYDKEKHTPVNADIEIWDVQAQTLIYNSGNAPTFKYQSWLQKNKIYEIRVFKDNYLPYIEQFSTSNVNAQDVSCDISLTPIFLNTFYVLNNLHFNRQNNQIGSNTAWVLHKIFDVLQQNPQFSIRFSAVSFHEGKMDVLSNVVKNCVEYLMDKGITTSRLLVFDIEDISLPLSDQSILSNFNNSASPNKHEKNISLVLKIENSENKTF